MPVGTERVEAGIIVTVYMILQCLFQIPGCVDNIGLDIPNSVFVGFHKAVFILRPRIL